MLKFLIAVASVAILLIAGNVQPSSLSMPDIPYALMVIPEILVVFALGLFLSLR
ncbi:MAG: hypothetical protein KDJ45_12655 [Hyphomicrobiaceae bacterium]|mgnify:CR=1 FL=1|nr:hypothetical protein [Hyphomicrobiaceae bacterium]MCC0010228.1 hypothetical protein [Hyphomicrobiaceae bacterium]